MEAVFRDKHGREWRPRVTVPVMYEFCSVHGLAFEDIIQLRDIGGKRLFYPRLNFAQQIDLLWMSVQHQVRVAAGTTREEFIDGLSGRPLQDGIKAIMAAVADFFRSVFPPDEMKEVAAETSQTPGAGNTSIDGQRLPE